MIHIPVMISEFMNHFKRLPQEGYSDSPLNNVNIDPDIGDKICIINEDNSLLNKKIKKTVGGNISDE